MEKQVFISYNHRDTDSVLPFALKLIDALQQFEMDVWIDELNLGGGTWQPKIMEALVESDAVVIAISSNGIGNWGSAEIEVALSEQMERDIPVTPVLLEDAPEGIENDIPKFLKRNSYIDLRPGKFNEKIRFLKLIGKIKGGEQPKELLDLYKEYYRNRGHNGDNQTDDKENKKPEDTNGTQQDDQQDDQKDRKEVLLERAARYFHDSLRQDNITFFLGTGAAHPPSVQDMTRELLADLELISDVQNTLLLPAITTAGNYYAVKRNETGLELKIKEIISTQSKQIPAAYARLVQLMAELEIKRTQRRSRKRSPQLIVTTNFDMLLECALLRAGLRFTRIVQNRSRKSIQVDQYTQNLSERISQDDLPDIEKRLAESVSEIPEAKQRLEEIQQRVDERDLSEIDRKEIEKEKNEVLIEWIADHSESREQYKWGSFRDLDINMEKAPSIVLYKFHGSLDVSKSCVISTDQYLNFIVQKQEYGFIPEQILAIVDNTPSLFLGYGPLDPSLRLTYYVMEEELKKTGSEQNYAIPVQETTPWGNILEEAFRTMDMVVLDEPIDLFLERLIRPPQ